MHITLFSAAFGIAGALAQASYGSPEFSYWGCASVDPAGFSDPVLFPNGGLAPEACQVMCGGHMFAAVAPDGCRCGDDPNAIIHLEESACNHPCAGGPNAGTCGGVCPETGPGISNVFTNNNVLVSDPPPPPPAADPAPPTTGVPIPPDEQTPAPSPPAGPVPPPGDPPAPPSVTIGTSSMPGSPSEPQVPSPSNATVPGGSKSKESPRPVPSQLTQSDSCQIASPMLATAAEIMLMVAIII